MAKEPLVFQGPAGLVAYDLRVLVTAARDTPTS